MHRLAIVVAGILLLSVSAIGEEPAGDPGRFQIAPDAEGFTRLDTETGAISHCGKREGVWTCEPLAEADSDLTRRLDALGSEITRLSAELAAVSARLGSLARRLDTVTTRSTAAGDPAEADARRQEEALNFAEKLMRRFFDMVRELKRSEAESI